VVELTAVHGAVPSRYMKSPPRMAGSFNPLVVYQVMSPAGLAQLVSCCPDKTWLPYRL
jgi:hypothetical protein